MDVEENNKATLPQTQNFFILGSKSFAHEALALALQSALGINCILVSTVSEIDDKSLRASMERVLFLIDGQERDPDTVLAEIKSFPAASGDAVILVLFNLPLSSGVEREAFIKGVRGFFYKEDSLEHMLRGLRALLNGHLWMSRDILVEFALLGSTKRDSPLREKTLLTEREKQVLALVSIGASNEEIGEKLFISPHTVKTHLYNTFKKIGVPNRFQAALWAARNL